MRSRRAINQPFESPFRRLDTRYRPALITSVGRGHVRESIGLVGSADEKEDMRRCVDCGKGEREAPTVLLRDMIRDNCALHLP